MEILLDENNDLREEVKKLRALTADEKSKEMTEENQRLRRRNGELVIKVTDLESEITKLKKESAVMPKSERANMGMFHTTTGFFPRPQTAVHRSAKINDLFPSKDEDLDAVSAQLDEELEDMIAQN